MALVSELFSRISTILQDTAEVRWTSAEKLMWFNDALRDIVNIDPAASTQHYTVTLVAGAKQSLPTGAMLLMDVTGNVKADGSAGNQIRMCDRATLDASFPKWQTETQKDSIQNVMYDPANRRVFWVYPPAKAGTKVEMVCSYFPTVTSTTSTVPLEAIYHTPLMDYVLYRALSKDTEAGDQARASAYLSAFTAAVNALAAVRGGAQPKE